MHDIEGELLYLRARYYEPATMRFLQQDTVLGNINDPLSRNLYAYAQGNPLKYVDPSGHVVVNVKGASSVELKENNNIIFHKRNVTWEYIGRDVFSAARRVSNVAYRARSVEASKKLNESPDAQLVKRAD